MYGFLRFIAPKWNFLHWPDAMDGITGPDFHKTLEGNTLQGCQLYLSNFCPKINSVPSITGLLKLCRIAQCGNLAIFLPLWICVKSIVADFRRSKTAILTISVALNFEFWKFLTFSNVKYFQNSNFNGSFNFLKSTKLPFRPL